MHSRRPKAKLKKKELIDIHSLIQNINNNYIPCVFPQPANQPIPLRCAVGVQIKS